MVQAILEMIIAFAIGSVPFGVLICQAFKLQDPKSYGSGNIGATNVARQNKLAGFATLLLDAAKGALAVLLLSSAPSTIFAVVLGHCYSPLMRFNGGKGVATALGAIAISLPQVTGVLAILWLTVLAKGKTVGAASIFASGFLVIYALLMKSIWLCLLGLLIILRHARNVAQLTAQ